MIRSFDVRRAADFVAADPPRRRYLFGLFGGIDWVKVVAIVVEIVRRILESQGVQVPAREASADPGERLDPGTLRRLDREFPPR